MKENVEKLDLRELKINVALREQNCQKIGSLRIKNMQILLSTRPSEGLNSVLMQFTLRWYCQYSDINEW